MYYKIILIFLLAILCGQEKLIAQNTDDLNLNTKLGKVDSTNIFQLDDAFVWCGSAIKGKDGKYYLFYSRWKHGRREVKNDPFDSIFDNFGGWLKYSEIACAVSDRLNGPYKHLKVILKGTGEANRWDQYTMHNPQIRKFGSKYYLYYVSNSFNKDYKLTGATPEWLQWMKYNSSQRIGVLSANSIEDILIGKYTTAKQPLMEPDGKQTFEIAVNPSVTQGPDGLYYMIFKSRKPNVGNMTHWIATAAHPTGPFTLKSQVFTSAEMACEDPCIWYDKRRERIYAAVKYYSNSKKLVSQFGALALITSKNGLDWEGAKHPLISLRELNFKNGEVLKLANLERPFIVMDAKGVPTALFAAAAEFEPKKNVGDVVQKGYNSFNVSIPLVNK